MNPRQSSGSTGIHPAESSELEAGQTVAVTDMDQIMATQLEIVAVGSRAKTGRRPIQSAGSREAVPGAFRRGDRRKASGPGLPASAER